MTALPRKHLSMAVALAALLGCDSTTDGGGPGIVTFNDAGGGCDAEPLGVDTPIAAGARLDVRVLLDEVPMTVSSASTVDGTVLSVEDTTGNIVGLRATGLGATELRVDGPAGERGTLGLRVVTVDSGSLAPTALSLPNVNASLAEPHPEGTDALLEAGWALLPDGWIELDVVWRGDGDTILRGWDLADWTADPALVDLERVGDLSDDVKVSHGGVAGSTTISIHGGSTFDLVLHPAGSAAALSVYLPDTGTIATSLEVRAGRVATVVAVLQDQELRILRGHDGQPLTASVADPDVVAIVPPPWTEGDDAVELTEALEDLLEASSLVYVRGGQSPGTTTLTLERAGLSVDIPISVTE